MGSARVRAAAAAAAVVVWLGLAVYALGLTSPLREVLGGALIVTAAYCLVWAAEAQAARRSARTEHHRARELSRLHAAAEEGTRREAALEHSTDAILIVLSTGQVEYVNPTAKRFLQDRVLEVSGRLHQPDLERIIDQARSTGRTVSEDLTLWVPGARHARVRALPLGEATVVLLSDLTESHRLDRVRRDFVANVSHELKTPVAAIRALAETAGTALTSDDLDTATRFVERLGTEATRLAVLVSDLLDLSRVEAGELQRSVVDLDVLLVEAAERGRVVGEAKDIDVVVRPNGLRIQADGAQLSMAVGNLVDNAVRYSETGTVEIAALQRGDLIEIAVADEGVGIPADELGRIFERFYRVDKGRARATGGTGLGLAIVRHVVENHGGEVGVTSELGVGTTFRITIPVGTPPESIHPESAA